MNAKDCSCACSSQALGNEDRRKVLRLAAGGLVAGLTLAGRSAQAAAPVARVVPGDLLVEDDADGEPTPLKVADLKPGKPLLAFPFDAAKKQPRSETRLNKVVLIRFAESELDARLKAVSAGGVLAFSSVCTHNGCDVKTWMAKEQVLACFCHGSKFAPTQAGAVMGGPAPRPLPLLPLALKGDTLVIAGDFTAPPGYAPA